MFLLALPLAAAEVLVSRSPLVSRLWTSFPVGTAFPGKDEGREERSASLLLFGSQADSSLLPAPAPIAIAALLLRYLRAAPRPLLLAVPWDLGAAGTDPPTAGPCPGLEQ